MKVEEEVLRLERLKVSKMKELVLKKKTELEELRRQCHLVVEEAENEPEVAISAIESGIHNVPVLSSFELKSCPDFNFTFDFLQELLILA